MKSCGILFTGGGGGVNTTFEKGVWGGDGVVCEGGGSSGKWE